MKKRALIAVVLLVLGFIFLVSPSAVAGSYDGVWWSPNVLGSNTFFIVRQVGVTIAAVSFELGSDAPPTVFLGNLNGTTAQMSSGELTPFLDIDITATFSSDSSATFILNSCSPSSECEETPVGIPFTIQKAF